MNISRIRAVAIFAALNYTSAGKWANERLAARLPKLPNHFPDFDKVVIQDPQVRKDLDLVLAAAEAGQAIMVVADKAENMKLTVVPKPLPAPKKPVSTPKKDPGAVAEKAVRETRKGAPASAPKPVPAPKKTTAPKDLFGFRLGTQTAEMNSAIPVDDFADEDEIIKKVGLPAQRVRDHLSMLKVQGKVEKKVVRFWKAAVK